LLLPNLLTWAPLSASAGFYFIFQTTVKYKILMRHINQVYQIGNMKKEAFNWKEFLKPTVKKINWTISIVLIAFATLYFFGVRGMGCNFNYPCSLNDISELIFPLLFPLHFVFIFGLKISTNIEIIDTIIGIIYISITVFYWYLISCIILFKYEKFRKYYFAIGAALIALICFYVFLQSYTFQSHGLEGIKNKACQQLLQTNDCAVEPSTIPVNYDVDDSGGAPALPGDNLQDFCTEFYLRNTSATCKALCSCPGY